MRSKGVAGLAVLMMLMGAFAPAAGAYANNGWRWGTANCAWGNKHTAISVSNGSRNHRAWSEGYGYTTTKYTSVYVKSNLGSGGWGVYVSSNGNYRYAYCAG